MNNCKIVLLIHPEGNTDNNPGLSGIVECMVKRGVFVVNVGSDRGRLASLTRRECYVRLGIWWRVFTVLHRMPHIGCLVILAAARFFLRSRDDRIGMVFGVDREGVILASFVAKRCAAPYAMLSYEIMFTEETSARFKAPEIRACRDLAFAVVQDRVRATDLSCENHIRPEKMVLVPVAGHGIRPRPCKGKRQAWPGIPTGKKVALCMGSLADWTMVDEVIAGLNLWPEDWVLLLHERFGLSRYISELASLEQYLGTKVFVSSRPYATLEGVTELLHAVDLGIAFYAATGRSRFVGRNVAHIGLASGKIAMYLQHGIPIVVNEIGEYTELTRSLGLGLVVPNPRYLGRYLAGFDPASCYEACLEFFRHRLDLAVTFEPLWQSFLQATQHRP